MISIADKKINDFVSKMIRFVAIVFGLGIVSYLPLIANGYTNDADGLWATTSYQAGDWELSIGRWAWPFLDKLREGYAAEPFNSVLTLVLIAVGLFLVFDAFGLKKHHIVYGMFFTVSTTVCCFLSYRYMSPTFGLSFLLSILVAVMLTKEIDNKKVKIIWYLVAVSVLAGTVGLYQANLGCYCLMIVVSVMAFLLKGDKGKALSLLAKGAAVGAVSCVFYKILWDVALRARGISAASYNGANSISVFSIIQMLPASIGNAYKSFFGFAKFKGFYILGGFRRALFIVLALWVLAKGIYVLRKDIASLALYVVLWLLIPVAANVFHVLAPQGTVLMMQMRGPLTIMIPMLLCIVEVGLDKEQQVLKYAVLAMGILFLYGNIYAVGADIDAMAQGAASAETILESVNASLIKEDLYGNQFEYAYVGELSDSPLFRKNELWENASSYAKFGKFGTNHDIVRNCYNGLLDDLGLNLQFVSVSRYNEILKDEKTEEMPVYPAEGSIVSDGNVVIIKISDVY